MLLHVMEQLLISPPEPPLNTYFHSSEGNYVLSAAFSEPTVTVGGLPRG